MVGMAWMAWILFACHSTPEQPPLHTEDVNEIRKTKFGMVGREEHGVCHSQSLRFLFSF